jgi:hypothetical protein
MRQSKEPIAEPHWFQSYLRQLPLRPLMFPIFSPLAGVSPSPHNRGYHAYPAHSLRFGVESLSANPSQLPFPEAILQSYCIDIGELGLRAQLLHSTPTHRNENVGYSHPSPGDSCVGIPPHCQAQANSAFRSSILVDRNSPVCYVTPRDTT